MNNINHLIDIIKSKNPSLEVFETNVKKNGITLQGISLRSPGKNAAPNIYIRDLEEKHRTPEEMANAVLSIFYSLKPFPFDEDKLFSPGYMVSSVVPVMQRKTDDCEYVKRDCIFPGTELILEIMGTADDGSSFAVKLTDPLIESTGLDREGLWEAAFANLELDVSIFSLSELIASAAGEAFVPQPGNSEMYVVTSSRKVKSAAAVLTEKFRSWCRQNGFRSVYVIPSSLHEVIVLNRTPDINKQLLDETVRSVNMNEVDPVEQLGDEAFIYDIDVM